MAPKKKRQQQKPASKSGTKQAPKLQISEENERRLRRLLLNTERQASTSTSAVPPGSSGSAPPDNLSRAQVAKRLRNVYDKLSLEGFTAEQIEQALSALNGGVTFESALDWLCLNIPGDELPLKFSRGASASARHEEAERTVRIISTAREGWVPSHRPLSNVEKEMPGISIKKKKEQAFSLDLGKSIEADWIRLYMENQEQEEEQQEVEQQQIEKGIDVDHSEASIIKEYHRARLAALDAKKQKDRKKQEHFGGIIRKLRQQMSTLGLSDEILATGSPEDVSCKSSASELVESSTDHDGRLSHPYMYKDEPVDDLMQQECRIEDPTSKVSSLNVSKSEKDAEVIEGTVNLELDNLFSEDAVPSGILPSDNSKRQKKERSSQFGYGTLLGNINELPRMGNSDMIPKALLQKFCQRLGWEAPKYNKLLEKENVNLYAVSILRTATGRGKSRKVGGLITIQLPDKEKMCTSTEDAQNKVAAFALFRLFSDVPVHQLLTEPYASLVKRWDEEELLNEEDNTDETRRTDFVDSLLNSKYSSTADPSDSNQVSFLSEREESERVDCYPACRKIQGSFPGLNQKKEAESYLLFQELENKKRMEKHMEMLQTRSSLPISQMKTDLLELLRINDVVVISGETGCGKTTQVPQFILDDMIESRQGGYCNIICTQPRRIAAISVAERVSDERCEPPPGVHGSVVGFQVRLESSRNEKTRLLFCTTGILLRRLAGDNDLNGVTHVVVDEVHERSLLSDFLLIVLKNLVERRSATGSNLKVILMSATVDSNLYQRYFNNCPVLIATGRTHPVMMDFLEDIYEKLNYSLPSDSPASGRIIMSGKGKFGNKSVDSHRGKRNLVLSSWGDESLLSENYINPCYDANAYEGYSEKTHQNLKKLIEDNIDYDLLEDLICFIDENYPAGAILVFLPGIAEIDSLVNKLIATYRFGGLSSHWVLPLHSSLASVDQRKVFLSPPDNIRKVIVATDIAETSITIDDIIYVIDTGKHKEKRYNLQKKMSIIVEDWISQSNAKQRQGRAGRVKPGHCFCLYTRRRFQSMRLFQVPEILRMPLTELCLQIKSLSLGDIKSFLSKAIEPPGDVAIASAISLLYEVGAIDEEEELTPLGYHLAKLPVDVLIGKMMLFGAIFGCLSPTLSIASFLSYKLPFLHPKDEVQNLERAKTTLMSENLGSGAELSESNRQSDHLLLAAVYSRWSRTLNENGPKAASQFCRSYFLSSSVLYMIRDMRVQFGNLLADIGLINLPLGSLFTGRRRKENIDNWFADMSQPFNKHSHHPSVVRSILCAGLYPNLAASTDGIIGTSLVISRAPPPKDQLFWFDGKREVHIHPSSVNFNLRKARYPFLVFLEKVETNRIYLRDTTVVSPYSVLLFGGYIAVQHQMGLVTIDGWLKLMAPAQVAVLFKELRMTLHTVLKELIQKPEIESVMKNEVVRSIVKLLVDEDKQCNE